MEIFRFYGGELERRLEWWWKNLTDVCRTWRHIIFASPYSLNVRLACTDRTPTRTSLDIWPPFPIAISCGYGELDDEGRDNIIAALEHHDRIIQIDIVDQKRFVSEKFTAVTRKPFPVLRNLRLSSIDEIVIHEEFLGGSVPCLRNLVLEEIAFLALPKFASSATHLSALTLDDIPMTGYISPEAMAACLATVPHLKFLSIGFKSPRSHPDRIGLLPPTRAVLPNLADFNFEGVSEYMEELVARIDTPKLKRLEIYFFMDVMIHIPQLREFIARTETIRPLNPAMISFSSFFVNLVLGSYLGVAELMISCRDPDWQVSLMAQVCSQLSPLLSHVERLDVGQSQARQGNGIDPMQWFELFNPFPSVQSLYVRGELRPLVARALQGLTGERATDLLPTLRHLYLKGPSPSGSIREDIQTFIAARQHSNHPVEVHWE